MTEERLGDGRARLVRHDHGPERTIQTGIGPVPAKRTRLRDRGTNGIAITATPTEDAA
jgi:putative transposase